MRDVEELSTADAARLLGCQELLFIRQNHETGHVLQQLAWV
jgi:hypothetical protein